ncbi:MAG: RnfABCDGE type electron transport complex subunit D [Eubacterium sp.]
MNLSHTVPFFIPIIGGAFAIVVVKMIFGGLGQNFMNPALGARCFLLLAFTGPMTSFTFDGVSGATPLAVIKDGALYSDTMAMFTGRIAGTIGETSVIALLIGAIFLILLGVIDLRIPGTYIITFVIFIVLFGGHLGSGDLGQFVVQEVCGGGLILGAFFMATEPCCSLRSPPKKGKTITWVICGCLLGIFRKCSVRQQRDVLLHHRLPACWCRSIERFTILKPFGKEENSHGMEKSLKDALILFLIHVTIAGLGYRVLYMALQKPQLKKQIITFSRMHTVRYSRMQMHSTIWTDLILKKQQKHLLQQQDTQMTRLKTVLSL